MCIIRSIPHQHTVHLLCCFVAASNISKHVSTKSSVRNIDQIPGRTIEWLVLVVESTAVFHLGAQARGAQVRQRLARRVLPLTCWLRA